MKKKSLVLAILISTFYISNAQIRKHNHRCAFSLAINNIYYPMGVIAYGGASVNLDGIWAGGGEKKDYSYSLSIIPKYFINNDFALRFEFGLTCINQNIINTTGNGSGTSTSTSHTFAWDTITEKTFKYIPGVEWSCIKTNKIELHVGILVPYLHCSDVKDNSHSERRDNATDSLIYSGRIERTIDGGFAAGLGALIGSDFYLLKNISLGLEFSTAYLYYYLGGNDVLMEINQIGHQQPTYGTTISQLTYKGMRLEKVFASFNISIHL